MTKKEGKREGKGRNQTQKERFKERKRKNNRPASLARFARSQPLAAPPLALNGKAARKDTRKHNGKRNEKHPAPLRSLASLARCRSRLRRSL